MNIIDNIMHIIHSMINELQNIKFKKIGDILANMVIVLIFIGILVLFFILLDIIIIKLIKLITKIDLLNIMSRIIGR